MSLPRVAADAGRRPVRDRRATSPRTTSICRDRGEHAGALRDGRVPPPGRPTCPVCGELARCARLCRARTRAATRPCSAATCAPAAELRLRPRGVGDPGAPRPMTSERLADLTHGGARGVSQRRSPPAPRPGDVTGAEGGVGRDRVRRRVARAARSARRVPRASSQRSPDRGPGDRQAQPGVLLAARRGQRGRPGRQCLGRAAGECERATCVGGRPPRAGAVAPPAQQRSPRRSRSPRPSAAAPRRAAPPRRQPAARRAAAASARRSSARRPRPLRRRVRRRAHRPAAAAPVGAPGAEHRLPGQVVTPVHPPAAARLRGGEQVRVDPGAQRAQHLCLGRAGRGGDQPPVDVGPADREPPPGRSARRARAAPAGSAPAAAARPAPPRPGRRCGCHSAPVASAPLSTRPVSTSSTSSGRPSARAATNRRTSPGSAAPPRAVRRDRGRRRRGQPGQLEHGVPGRAARRRQRRPARRCGRSLRPAPDRFATAAARWASTATVSPSAQCRSSRTTSQRRPAGRSPRPARGPPRPAPPAHRVRPSGGPGRRSAQPGSSRPSAASVRPQRPGVRERPAAPASEQCLAERVAAAPTPARPDPGGRSHRPRRRTTGPRPAGGTSRRPPPR